MGDPGEIREAVRARYAAAARQAMTGDHEQVGGEEASCCASAPPGPSCSDGFGPALYDGEEAAGVPVAALAASLGCGVPTAVAELHPGEVVLDLGSGAGADLLISARRVAPGGRAIGLDMIEEMLELARRNASEAGVDNVELLHGYLEELPLPDASVDVVISNCVINLAADKARVLSEAARVLRSGGRLAVSDVLADPDMDEATRADMAAWTGCVAGALTKDRFASLLSDAGLVEVEIAVTHRVHPHASAAIVRARKPAAGHEEPRGVPAGVSVRVVPMAASHWPGVRDVYAAGIATGHATFEVEPPTWEVFDAGHLCEHRFVALGAQGDLLGWVAASAVSGRCVYAGVVEDSVYVHPAAAGEGVGRALIDALIESTESAGIWTIQCGVFPENLASLALHRRVGFREVGFRRRLGYMSYGPLAARWRDVVLLERRSEMVGVAQPDPAGRTAFEAATAAP